MDNYNFFFVYSNTFFKSFEIQQNNSYTNMNNMNLKSHISTIVQSFGVK